MGHKGKEEYENGRINQTRRTESCNAFWDYQGEVPFLDLIETVKEKLNKDYKRTSIRGYLFRLEEKGYIKVTKKGRKAYVQPLIDEETYGKYQTEEVLDRWFDGSIKRLVSALGEKLTKEDGEELKRDLR